jgi:hypothetical protein
MQKVLLSQQFIITSLVFLLASGSFAGLSIKDRLPRKSLNPSMIPTIPLLFLSGAVAFFALLVMVAELKVGQASL